MKKIQEYFILLTPSGGGPISKRRAFNVYEMERLFLFSTELLHRVEACNNMTGNAAEYVFIIQ